MNAALPILILFFAGSIGLGVWSKRGKEMNLEQWSVGGRGFGSIIVFLLLAGEIYTTFTFLGASGYPYSNGGAAFYILCYGALAYVFSYWLAPAIWRYGSKEKLVSQPDWFSRKYSSRNLSLIVTLIGVVAMIPYLQLQLTGLGIIIEETSYGAIPRSLSIILGGAAMATYVVISGIHSAAWNAVIKDILVLVVVVFIGIYLPLHYFGGIGAMFAEVHAQDPTFLQLHEPVHDSGWFITSILLSALGFFMCGRTTSWRSTRASTPRRSGGTRCSCRSTSWCCCSCSSSA
jgi:solute:Na+ symporter, SSS family